MPDLFSNLQLPNLRTAVSCGRLKLVCKFCRLTMLCHRKEEKVLINSAANDNFGKNSLSKEEQYTSSVVMRLLMKCYCKLERCSFQADRRKVLDSRKKTFLTVILWRSLEQRWDRS